MFKKIFIITLCCLLVLSFAGCGQPQIDVKKEAPPAPSNTTPDAPKEVKQISFGGSAPGGVYYYMVGVMAPLLNEKIPSINVTNVSTAASVANATGVAKGELDFGLTYGSLVWEIWNAKGTYEGKGDLGKTVTGLVKAYESPHYFVVLKGSGIKSIKDLAGKKVAVGPAGSGAQYNSDLIFKALNIDAQQEFLSFADAAYALKEKRVAAVGQSGAPSGAVTELAETADIEILEFSNEEMDVLEKVMPFYHRANLPKETYKGMTKDVQMPYFSVYWIANKNVPADVVEKVMEVALDPANRPKLVEGYKLWAEMTPDSKNFESLGAPIHPGAKAYFEKNNINK
ncbi:MAG: TAXI family TRAP transporter solute-binding subunit [Bacillota bacterium]